MQAVRSSIATCARADDRGLDAIVAEVPVRLAHSGVSGRTTRSRQRRRRSDPSRVGAGGARRHPPRPVTSSALRAPRMCAAVPRHIEEQHPPVVRHGSLRQPGQSGCALRTAPSQRAHASLLTLSPKTLESHVRSIFTKLDIAAEPNDHRRVLAVLTRDSCAHSRISTQRASGLLASPVAIPRRRTLDPVLTPPVREGKGSLLLSGRWYWSVRRLRLRRRERGWRGLGRREDPT